MTILFHKYKDMNDDSILWEGDRFGAIALTVSKREEYSEEELIANTLYIFLLLVMFAIITASVCFGLREYSISKEHEVIEDYGFEESVPAKEVEDNKDVDVEQMNAEDIKSLVVEGPIEPVVFAPPHTGISLTVSSNELNSISPSLPIHFPLDEAEVVAAPESIQRESEFEIIDIALTSTAYSGGSISNYLNKRFTTTAAYKSTKLIYTFQELYNFKLLIPPSSDKLFYHEDIEPEKLYNSLKGKSWITYTHFENAYLADKKINETMFIVSPPSSGKNTPEHPHVESFLRRIHILSIISIGATYIPSNPNYFLFSFNNLVIGLIDSGNIFNLLEESSDIPQQELMSVIVCYCWNHWMYRESNKYDRKSIGEIFKGWKLSEPNALLLTTIIRLLLNMQLGLASGSLTKISQQLLQEFQYKVSTLLQFICSNSHCNDFIGFIPLISQSINIVSEQSENKIIYYDLVYQIVKQHCKCCMNEYIKDSRTDLKAIVQHGLWYQHHFKVCEQANKIYFLLTEGGYDLRNWIEEIERGKIYVPPSAIVFSESKGERERGRERVKKSSTPGSWIMEKTRKGVEERAGERDKEGDRDRDRNREGEGEGEGEGRELKRTPSLRKYGYQ